MPSDLQHMGKFETIAFTKVPLPPSGASDLARQSCAALSSVDAGSAAYQSLVVRDVGAWDGVQRLLFAYPPLQHWSTKLLLHDALHRFLTIDYDLGLDRFVHIDIDDVFVTPNRTGMNAEDVQASGGDGASRDDRNSG